MSKKLIIKWLSLSVCLFGGTLLSAQDGTHNGYTPYSVYGIGDLQTAGCSFNMGMGGVGIATRNRRFVNVMNPASVTARDTLSFMADFGLSGRASLFRQGDLKSAHNTFNISDFVISFPIYRTSALMIGITPFSNAGYDFSFPETDPERIGVTGGRGYSASGNGSLYQLFAAYGMTFGERLSVGAEFRYLFGNLDKTVYLTFSDATYRNVTSGYVLQLRGTGWKFGVQYEQPAGGRMSVTVGATYRLKTKMGGYVTDFAYASLSSQTDTLRYRTDTLRRSGSLHFSGEFGLGICLKSGDRWTLEVDYLRSDWSDSGMDGYAGFANLGTSTFSSGVSQSLRAGFEITPNRNDIRYAYNRWTYRAGAYFDEAYYRMNGHAVRSYGLTFGMTLPVYMGYNGLTFGVDIGRRGNVKNGMIRERYIGFNIGFNIFDIWFRKPKYD